MEERLNWRKTVGRILSRAAPRAHFLLRRGERFVGATFAEARRDRRDRYEITAARLREFGAPCSFGLDVFCGCGYGVWCLADQLGAVVWGIDGSADAIRVGIFRFHRQKTVTT